MAKVDVPFRYYARVGDNRVICGLLHIIVRNDMETKDDAIDEYHTHWSASPGSGVPEANAMGSSPFTGAANKVLDGDDPDRTLLRHAIGDYDTYLFFVTVAARQAAAVTPGTALSGNHTLGTTANTLNQTDFTFVTNGLVGQTLTNTTTATSSTIDGNSATQLACDPALPWYSGNAYRISNTPEGNTWYSQAPTHLECQSFVRYQLIARHNNAYGFDTQNYQHYGQLSEKQYITAQAQVDQPDGVYAVDSSGELETLLVRNTSTFSDQNFGADLSNIGNNTYFSPVSKIEIYGYHTLEIDTEEDTFISGVDHFAIQRHDSSFYQLIVDIDLFGFNNGSANVPFFRNKINIFFQPFGESAEVSFSQTPNTGFTS
jgi:hypothetical protein